MQQGTASTDRRRRHIGTVRLAATLPGTRPSRLATWSRRLGCLSSAFLTPSGLHAQAPGYQQLNPGSVRAEYIADALGHINELASEWEDAWATDRVDDLAELYWEDAMLLPVGGIPIRGRAAILDYFAEVLPDYGHIEAFMLDFDASGGDVADLRQLHAGHSAWSRGW